MLAEAGVDASLDEVAAQDAPDGVAQADRLLGLVLRGHG